MGCLRKAVQSSSVPYIPTSAHTSARPPQSAEARDFVSRLLVRDPAQRMSALEALSHPWLSRPARPAPGHAGNGDGRAAGLDLDVSIVQRLQCFATFPKIKQEALLRIVQVTFDPLTRTTPSVSV